MSGNTKAYAIQEEKDLLKPFSFDRRDVGDADVRLDIEYCGVCHSDIHTGRNEWGFVIHPLVPGHEMVGKVTEVGKEVTKYKVGDIVGVGCFVDSCRSCTACKQGEESYCPDCIFSYNCQDMLGNICHGGYSSQVRFMSSSPWLSVCSFHPRLSLHS
eukprot:m.75628 g.75628  ORF g.75628 m.75628 type:complete len:157 (-) comp20531_c0_seq2:17-487(-)